MTNHEDGDRALIEYRMDIMRCKKAIANIIDIIERFQTLIVVWSIKPKPLNLAGGESIR